MRWTGGEAHLPQAVAALNAQMMPVFLSAPTALNDLLGIQQAEVGHRSPWPTFSIRLGAGLYVRLAELLTSGFRNGTYC